MNIIKNLTAFRSNFILELSNYISTMNYKRV
jgi:hypothetical protein